MAYGLSPEGGSTRRRHSTRPRSRRWQRATAPARPRAARWGFFLRAETMHGLYTYLEDNASPADPASTR